MKKEVLCINNLNFPYARGHSLKWISLTLFEGESTGFLGLSDSGKDGLIRILTGQIQVRFDDLSLSIDGKQISSEEMLAEKIYHLNPLNYRIGEWTVAEYIGLKQSGWLLLGSRKRTFIASAQGLFERMGVSLDVTRKLKHLSELELRLTDLGKACLMGARVLVIEDEFEGMTREEIYLFADVLKQVLRKERFAVIVSTHSDLVNRALAQQYVIFRDGNIIKKCRREAIQSQDQMESYLLGGMIGTKKGLDAYVQEHSAPEQDDRSIVMRARGIPIDRGRIFERAFRRGSVTTILALTEAERRKLFLNLSGREMDEKAYCVIDDRRLTGGEYLRFLEQRIVSVMHLGSTEGIFDNMSVEENILLPSLRKISSKDYLFSSGQLTNAVSYRRPQSKEAEEDPSGLEFNDRLTIVLERWYLYHPKVLILLEPFAQCDIYGASILRSYIRRFADRGTAVIVIKCREEGMENMSDEVVRLY